MTEQNAVRIARTMARTFAGLTTTAVVAVSVLGSAGTTGAAAGHSVVGHRADAVTATKEWKAPRAEVVLATKEWKIAPSGQTPLKKEW